MNTNRNILPSSRRNRQWNGNSLTGGGGRYFPTPRRPQRHFFTRAAHSALLLFGFVLNAVAQASAANTPATKDHVLFVGTDLSVKQDGEFYRVVGATKKTLKIEKDRAMADVRLSGSANIRINKGVKLSSLSANINNVRTESTDRVAARAQLDAMQASMLISAEADDRQDRLQGGIIVADQGTSFDPRKTFNPAASQAFIDKMRGEAREAYSSGFADLARSTDFAAIHLNGKLTSEPIDDEVTLDASNLPGLHSLASSGIGGSTNIDYSLNRVQTGTSEVELTFEVSSPEPLENAYIVVVANYASPTKPGEAARQISAREFEQIDSRPKRVKMIHAASMNGLVFKKFDIALFANGQEVATNLSEKRLALTSDQAFQFFLIDHLSTHRGATLPPTPMLMTPRTEFRRQVAKIETNQAIYANVDKMGNVLSTSTDAAGTQRLPSSVESALQKVRFLPALNNGAPVEGRIKVTLAQLAH